MRAISYLTHARTLLTLRWPPQPTNNGATPDISGLGGKTIVARGSKVSHYFRMQMHEFCRGYIVAYNLTDDESTMKFSFEAGVTRYLANQAPNGARKPSVLAERI